MGWWRTVADLNHITNTRTEILAAHVTATGFEFVFRTWGDTRAARIRAEWTRMRGSEGSVESGA